MTASESPLSRTERETGGGDAWERESGGEETIDSAWAPPPMNDCTLVISAAERVTTAGGCRSSGANGSLRYTLRGGRASAGSQERCIARIHLRYPLRGGRASAGSQASAT